MGMAFRGIKPYRANFKEIERQSLGSKVAFPITKMHPCLTDRYDKGGHISSHYFHQDLHVARRIYANKPNRHIDVGSRVDGFVAHLAVFREVEVFDVRPMSNPLIKNITFHQADFSAEIDRGLHGTSDSISCLHALEHFGLGRYGDPVKYSAYLDGLKNLALILCKGGTLYLSVPIGPQRIEFDAHRVFAVEYLLELLAVDFKVIQFSYVSNRGEFHEDVSLNLKEISNNFGCTYGCGIFELKKT